MTPLDRNIVERKLEIILLEITHLESYLTGPLIDFQNFHMTYSLIFSLQKGISAALDIAQHIVVKEANKIPDSYTESVLELGNLKVFPAEFAERISVVARFRNRLVHEYEKVDIPVILSFLPQAINDLKEFVKYIKIFVG